MSSTRAFLIVSQQTVDGDNGIAEDIIRRQQSSSFDVKGAVLDLFHLDELNDHGYGQLSVEVDEVEEWLEQATQEEYGKEVIDNIRRDLEYTKTKKEDFMVYMCL